MQLIQTLFLVLVALIIPAFFAVLFVLSAYHRLVASRARCERILSESSTVSDPSELAELRRAHHLALAEYHQTRRRFPASWLSHLFRLTPPAAWPDSNASVPSGSGKDETKRA